MARKTVSSSDLDLDALADELAEFAPADKRSGATAREERIRAGFEEIARFVARHGRVPQPDAQGEEAIFERLYATRLTSLQNQADCMALLADLDPDGLLQGRKIFLRGCVQGFLQNQAIGVIDQVKYPKAGIHVGVLRFDFCTGTANAFGGDFKNGCIRFAQGFCDKLVGLFLFFGINGLWDLHQDKTTLAAIFGVQFHYRLGGGAAASEEI